jgi:fructosamine-3-kinase
VPDAFFAAYHELRPAEPGWRDHLLLFHLRELLCMIAQRNPHADRAARAVLDLVARYG